MLEGPEKEASIKAENGGNVPSWVAVWSFRKGMGETRAIWGNDLDIFNGEIPIGLGIFRDV